MRASICVCVCVCARARARVTDLTEVFVMQESQERSYGHLSSREKV